MPIKGGKKKKSVRSKSRSKKSKPAKTKTSRSRSRSKSQKGKKNTKLDKTLRDMESTDQAMGELGNSMISPYIITDICL